MRADRAALAATLLLAGCGGGGGSEAQRLQTTTVAARPAVVSPPIAVGRAPVAVAVGSQVWVANTVSGTVSRIEPRSRRVIGSPTPVGAGPRAVAVGPLGVWVATGAGQVVRLDPRTGAAGARVAVADPAGVAIGDGVVWVTSRTTGTVRRLDARTGRGVGAPVRVGSSPTDVVLAAGSAWVANSVAGTVTRIDARTGRANGDPIRVGKAQVLALAAGENGVWAAKTDRADARDIALVRIDPATGEVGATAVAIRGGIPTRLAAGAGAVWATAPGSPLGGGSRRAPGLLRIDPRRLARAGAPIDVGTQPQAVAVGPAGVWAADAGANAVVEVR